MSDPVTNVEIEDVLSSIRRLVAEGGKSRKDADAPKPVAAAPEKLLLTPALRVAPPTAEAEPARMAPLPLRKPLSIPAGQDRGFDFATLEATIAELEAAVTAQPDEWEPDGSELIGQPSYPLTQFPLTEEDDAPEVKAEAPMVADTLPEEEDEDDSAVITPFTTGRRSREDDADELAAMEAAFAAVAAPALDEEGGDAAGNAPAPDESGAGEDDAPLADDAGAAAEEAAFLHAPVAANTDDALAPGAADLAEDEVATFVRAEPEVDARFEEYLARETDIIDEEALREMVADILREELQGRLGERITRNVRKLVRSEIQRALAARGIN